MERKLTSMKWVGAARKLLPKALLKRLRSDVTFKNENINDTANRIGSVIQTLTEEANDTKKSLLEEHYNTQLSSGAASSPEPHTGSNLAATNLVQPTGSQRVVGGLGSLSSRFSLQCC